MFSERQMFATVRIKPNCKNCFVELSGDLAKQCLRSFGDNMPDAICIKSESANAAFASWIPREVQNCLQDKQNMYVGKAFADCMGVKEHDMVFLHPVLNTSPCEKVFVAPKNPEEWDILDLNSQLIEQTLLEQIRVVHPGLEFPVFLRGSAVVTLKIESITPTTRVGYLEEYTELHIAPKSTTESLIKKHWQNRAKNTNNVLFQSNFDKRKKPANGDNLYKMLSNVFGLSKREDNEIEKLFESKDIRPSGNLFPSPTSDEKHTDEVLRIVPISRKKHGTNDGSLHNYSHKLFNLLVSLDLFNLLHCAYSPKSDKAKTRIVMKVSKMLSPREKDERKKKQKKGGAGVTFKTNGERAAFVEVSFEKQVHTSLFDSTRWASASDELMAYLDVDQGSLIGINCMHDEASQLHGIVINVINVTDRDKDESKIRSLFQKWIEERLDGSDEEMLVNDSMVIKMKEMEGNSVLATVNFDAQGKRDADRDRYFFISKHSLENASIVIKFPSKEENNEPSKNLQKYFEKYAATKSVIGGFDELVRKGQNHLDASFQNRSFHGSVGQIHKGSLLICGSSRTTASGCGRTALSKALCDAYQSSPYFCHIEIIDCIPLRGKKPETILHRFTVAMEEARWRQPSIIVFDDLDALMKQPDPVKDAEPTIVYHTKLAEGLKDLLRKEISSSSKISIILVCKTRDTLHNIFSAPSGWHFIGNSLIVGPPDEAAREDMTLAILEKLSCIAVKNSDLRLFSMSTEGYLPADLEIVLKRAKNASLRSGFEKSSGLQIVREESLKEALFGYKPIGLRGIELHKPGNLGWENIGGLAEAKRVLKETFVWPMQYKSLFSNCPFRMRSGVLLYGPSGTGKTLLAGIVAKECGMNFVSIKGPELLSKYVGSSEQNVRDLFARAQSASPCILFFDEFDALAPKRGHDNTGVTDRVVNQLLTQLDGVEKLENVFILAATSRPDLIDPALLRPGRIDKCVYCPMPDENDRVEILTSLTKKLNIEADIDWLFISQRTVGFSGADLKALLYNAQLKVIHKRQPLITSEALQSMEKMKVSSEDDFTMKISEADILEALGDTNPSVSSTQMKQFEARFQNFIASRKGKSQPIEAGFRVTLA